MCAEKPNTKCLKEAYPAHFHICHSGEHHWGQLDQPAHAYWQVCYTSEPATPTIPETKINAFAMIETR